MVGEVHFGMSNLALTTLLVGKLGPQSDFAFSRNGQHVVTWTPSVEVPGRVDATGLTPVNTATGKLRVQLKSPPEITGFAFASDERHALVYRADQDVEVWDLLEGKRRWVVPTGPLAAVACLALSPDAQLLAAAPVDGNEIDLWQLSTGKRRTLPLDRDSTPLAVQFSGDSRTLAVATSKNRVDLWDVADGTMRRSVGEGPHLARVMAYSPDGTLLALAGEDRPLELWDATTGAPTERTHRSGGFRGLQPRRAVAAVAG